MSIIPEKFSLIGVAGLGLMGRGIAACLLSRGFRVIGYTVGTDTYDKARTSISIAIEELIEKAGFPSSLRSSWPDNFLEAHSLANFAPASFVIETVTEDFKIKQQVFDALEAALSSHVPIASNTSSLPITDLQRPRKHPERFLGMHWSVPSYNTRFLELIRGEQTGDAAFNLAAELARLCGKDPSLVQKDVPAFIANRLAYAMYREAVHLLETGVADAETIDSAFRNSFGLWAGFCGPLRWIDITGGPALYGKAMHGVLPTLSNASTLPTVLAKMQSDVYRGTTSGQGFYNYAPEDAAKWEKRYHDHVWRIFEISKNGD